MDTIIQEKTNTIFTKERVVNTVEQLKVGPPGPPGSSGEGDYMPYNLPIATKISDYIITSSDYTILLDGTSNTVTVILPTAVGISGRVFNLKCIDDTFTCTVDGDGTETIDGELTVVLTKHETITVQSEGLNWVII